MSKLKHNTRRYSLYPYSVLQSLVPFFFWLMMMLAVLFANRFFNITDHQLSAPKVYFPDQIDSATQAALWVRFLAYSLLSVVTYLLCSCWSIWVTYRMTRESGRGLRGFGLMLALTLTAAVLFVLAGTLDIPPFNAAKLALGGSVLDDFVNDVQNLYTGRGLYDARAISSKIADLGYGAAFFMLMAVCASLLTQHKKNLFREQLVITREGVSLLAAFPFLGSALMAVSILRTRAMMYYYANFEIEPDAAQIDPYVPKSMELLANATANYLGITYSLIIAWTFLPAAALLLIRARYIKEAIPPNQQDDSLEKINFAWLATSVSILVPALVGGSDLLRSLIN